MDADLRAGAVIPRKDSLRYDLVNATEDSDDPASLVAPIFGLTLGLGLTF